MKELICIVCPNSCHLYINKNNDDFIIKGHKCKRGEDFALNEMLNPTRTISSVVKTIYPQIPVIPVKVNKEIPKNEIFNVMNEINKVLVNKVIKSQDIVIKNVLKLDVDVICTSNILLKMEKVD